MDPKQITAIISHYWAMVAQEEKKAKEIPHRFKNAVERDFPHVQERSEIGDFFADMQAQLNKGMDLFHKMIRPLPEETQYTILREVEPFAHEIDGLYKKLMQSLTAQFMVSIQLKYPKKEEDYFI